MSKLLKDVTDYLKETQGLSMSQISKDLGKGRNYIREAIERDISMEKQIDIIEAMYYCTNKYLVLSDLLSLIKQQATKYHVAQEKADEFERQLIKANSENDVVINEIGTLNHQIITLEKQGRTLKRKIENSDRLYCESQDQRKDLEQRLYNATAKNKELEYQIVVLQKKIDEDQKEYVKGEVAQDNRIDHLTHLLNDSQNTIASMEKSQEEMTKAGQGIVGQLSAMTGSRNMWCLLFTLAVLFSCVLMYHAF